MRGRREPESTAVHAAEAPERWQSHLKAMTQGRIREEIKSLHTKKTLQIKLQAIIRKVAS